MRRIFFKYPIILFLMLSGLMAVGFSWLTEGFVVFVPYGEGGYQYLETTEGSSADDGVLLHLFGIISIIISVIMLFIKNETYFIRTGLSVYLFLFLLALLAGSEPLNKLVINTIQYDQNIFLILWCVFISIYTFLLLALNIYVSKDEE